MEHTIHSTSKSRRTIMVGAGIVALAAIVYFSFFYPPTPSNEVSGTIGAVKKYRSEQITDKDVNLASQQSEAIAAETAADVQAANELAATASAFEKTYRSLDNRVVLDKQIKAEFQRTIASLEKASQITLQRTQQSPSYDKAIAQTSYEKTASQGNLQKTNQQTLDRAAQPTYDKSIGQSNLQKTSEQTLDRAAQPTFDRTAVVALQRSIKSLDAKAQEIVARPWEGRGKMTFDKSTQLEMSQKLGDLQKEATSYEKSMRASFDKQAGATMDNRAKQDLQNREQVGNKAQ